MLQSLEKRAVIWVKVDTIAHRRMLHSRCFRLKSCMWAAALAHTWMWEESGARCAIVRCIIDMIYGVWSNIVLFLREEHLRHDVHCHQLLHQLLACIRNIHLVYLCGLSYHILTFLHIVHSYMFLAMFATAIIPHLEHTWTLNLSLTMNSRSLKNSLIPWDIMQSLSISPNLRPPARLRPCVGWRVRATTGPLLLAYILSSTKCLSLW